MSLKLYAGIDLGATNIKYGLVDEAGEIRFRGLAATPKPSRPEKLFEAIRRCGEQLLIESDNLGAVVETPTPGGAVEYIGVGSPGTVNIKTGVIQGSCPNLPGWEGFHLRDRLAQAINLPVYVDNDANCATLAEHQFGAGRGYENIICLTVGTGIGGGLIINGRLYRGVGYCAGEAGQIYLTNGATDRAQRLEKMVSSPAILEMVRTATRGKSNGESQLKDTDQLTMKKVFAAARRGDVVAVRALATAAEILGLALADLVNFLNPEMVILGGGIIEGGQDFVDKVKTRLMALALPCAVERLKVVPAALGNAAGFIGAAFLGREPAEA